jgi:hypothetical protein
MMGFWNQHVSVVKQVKPNSELLPNMRSVPLHAR